MKINNKKGFTLIELMVVIAIIGILATAGITQYTSYQMKSRDTVRTQTLGAIDTALASYYTDYGNFPEVKTDNCLTDNKGEASSEQDKEFKTYFPGGKAPLDPQALNKSGGCQVARSYGYKPLENGGLPNNSYYLVTNVEDDKNANTVWSPNLTGAKSADDVRGEIGKYAKGGEPITAGTEKENTVYAKLN